LKGASVEVAGAVIKGMSLWQIIDVVHTFYTELSGQVSAYLLASAISFFTTCRILSNRPLNLVPVQMCQTNPQSQNHVMPGDQQIHP